MRCKRSTFLSRLAVLFLTLSTSALKGHCAVSSGPLTTTNHYHARFEWNTVSNADAYAVITRSLTNEAWAWTSNSWLVISNLPGALDGVRFTAVSSNAAGLSDETPAVVTRLVTLLEGPTIKGPWGAFTTPVFEPTNQGRFFFPSNWRAEGLLKRD